MEISGWLVNASADGQYLYVQRDGAPGQIHVKAEDEGFAVDIWPDGDGEPAGATFALYTQLEPE